MHSQISEKWLLVSSCLSVRPSTCSHETTLGYHCTDFFYEIWYLSIFRKTVKKFQVSLKSDKHSGYFTWIAIHAQFFLEWDMFQTNGVEEIKTHILCSIFFFFENRAVYEIMWENIVQRGRPQMTIWRTRVACWVPKSTKTLTCFSTETMVATNAPQCYVIQTLPFSLRFVKWSSETSWKSVIWLTPTVR